MLYYRRNVVEIGISGFLGQSIQEKATCVFNSIIYMERNSLITID